MSANLHPGVQDSTPGYQHSTPQGKKRKLGCYRNTPFLTVNNIPNKGVPNALQFAPYDCLLEKEIQLTTGYLPGMFAKPRSTKRTALRAGSPSGVTDPCLYYKQTAQQAVALSARPLLRLTLPLPRMAVVRLRDAHYRERKASRAIAFISNGFHDVTT